MNITISINREYIKYACIMLMSLKEFHKDEVLDIYILNNDLEDKDFMEMDRVIGSEGINLIPVNIPKGTVSDFQIGQWPEVAALRLLVTDIFGGTLDRILHLDVDILITGSITELYKMDFEDQYLIACNDFLTNEEMRKKNAGYGRADDFPLFNSGVVLFNLEKMQKDGINYSLFQDIRIKYPNINIKYPDQDILNVVLGHKTKFADRNKFNYMPLYYRDHDPEHFYNTEDEIYKNCHIVHMATGNTPWTGIYKLRINEIWWDYAKRTPYFLEIKKEHLQKMSFIERKLDELNHEKSDQLIEMIHHGKEVKEEELVALEDCFYQLISNELESASTLEKLQGQIL